MKSILGRFKKTTPLVLVGSLIFASIATYWVPSFPVAKAAACSATASGNWSSSATWTSCGGGTPQSGDTVTIPGSRTVTLDTTATISALVVDAAGTLNGSSGTLSIVGAAFTGGFTVNGTFNAGTSTIKLIGGLTIAGGISSGIAGSSSLTFYNLEYAPVLSYSSGFTPSYCRRWTDNKAFAVSNSFTVGSTSTQNCRFLYEEDFTVTLNSGATLTLTAAGSSLTTFDIKNKTLAGSGNVVVGANTTFEAPQALPHSIMCQLVVAVRFGGNPPH